LFTIDNDYELKIDEAEATLAAAESKFQKQIGSVLASISVSNANVQSAAGILKQQNRLVVQQGFNRYENL
jgi:multidrug resistance efflux pump